MKQRSVSKKGILGGTPTCKGEKNLEIENNKSSITKNLFRAVKRKMEKKDACCKHGKDVVFIDEQKNSKRYCRECLQFKFQKYQNLKRFAQQSPIDRNLFEGSLLTHKLGQEKPFIIHMEGKGYYDEPSIFREDSLIAANQSHEHDNSPGQSNLFQNNQDAIIKIISDNYDACSLAIQEEVEEKQQEVVFKNYLDNQIEAFKGKRGRSKSRPEQEVTISLYLPGQMNAIHNKQDSYNVEVQKLKNIVQREEERLKQKLEYMQKEREDYMRRLETISALKHDLNSVIQRDLFYVKPESQEIYIFDFERMKFDLISFAGKGESHVFPKSFSCVQSHNGDIYLFGGVHQRTIYSRKTLQIGLAQGRQEIQEKAPMLIPKINIPIALIKSKYVYLCGGFCKQMMGDCEIYSIDEDKWYRGPTLNYPRANCSACNFDDRFIYIITGKVESDPIASVWMEKLDTGLDGSAQLMQSLDEDLNMCLNFKWQVIKIENSAACKEFIENVHFNGSVQVSHNEILIFGGVQKLTFILKISEGKKEKLIKLDDQFKQVSFNRFVYEKDFQAVVRKNEMYAIDPNYKMLHILNLDSLKQEGLELRGLEESQELEMHVLEGQEKLSLRSGRSYQSSPTQDDEEVKKRPLSKTRKNLGVFQRHVGSTRNTSKGNIKFSLQSSFNQHSMNTSGTSVITTVNNGNVNQQKKSEWKVMSFKSAGITSSTSKNVSSRNLIPKNHWSPNK